jgi:putative isomerase
MTYWAARGAARYGRREEPRTLLEAALDDTAAQYKRTGTVWELYAPDGGKPEDLTRKPQTKRNLPFAEDLRHNPLLAMARLWSELQDGSK